MEIQGRWRGRGDGDEEKKKSFYDRQVPSSAVNREDVTAKSDVGSVEECSKLEFTKDEVFALLSERAKAGKFDTKGKIEQMTDIIKRLKGSRLLSFSLSHNISVVAEFHLLEHVEN
ncbi:hypothetical protein Bca101_083182 [Brassica carinata]